jgi:mono/diheme cytochrome c family protein
MNIKRLVWPIILVTMGALSLAACAPSAPEAPAVQAEEAEHEDDGGHSHSPDDHMAGAHDVPAEAAAVPNPIEANHESLEAGEQLFATNCAVCHGESGQGDGPGAAGLEKPPANLNAGHVQGLTDGALFYIVSHGRPDTPMPAWDNVLNEEQRWQVVNYLRTFNDGEGGDHTGDEHPEEGELDAEAENHADDAAAEADEHHEEAEHHEDEEEHHEDEEEHHEEDGS